MTSFSLVRGVVAASRRACISANRRAFSVLVPLEDEYPGLPALSPTQSKATSVSVTTLPNGLTVVTEDASTTSTVSLTYPKAGSSSEMIDEHGAALFNKCMSFKSGSGMSSLLINRTIEDEGGVPFASVNRKSASVGFTVAPEKAIGLIPLLATSCSFEKWDVRDAQQLASTEMKVASESAQIILTENLFAAAFGPQSPAGRSLYYTNVSRDAVVAFRERSYGLNGAVLAATGVKDHSAFVTEAGSLLGGSQLGSALAPPSMCYIGGESRIAAPSAGYAHIALGFHAPVSSAVASVVKHFFNLAGLEAGISAFCSTGVIGVYAGSTSPGGLVDTMIAVVKKAVSPDLVKRAKKLAKAEALFNLDGGSQALANFMTASVLESGTFTSPGDVAKAYDAVTDIQIKDALASILKSNPSLAAVGNISAVPYHATVKGLM